VPAQSRTQRAKIDDFAIPAKASARAIDAHPGFVTGAESSASGGIICLHFGETFLNELSDFFHMEI
jgi:hypothetical protein